MVCLVDTSRSANEAWVSRQALQDVYQKLLVMDLEFALDKKVEQELYVLYSLGFTHSVIDSLMWHRCVVQLIIHQCKRIGMLSLIIFQIWTLCTLMWFKFEVNSLYKNMPTLTPLLDTSKSNFAASSTLIQHCVLCMCCWWPQAAYLGIREWARALVNLNTLSWWFGIRQVSMCNVNAN